MRITFVLPGWSLRKPIGGFKVVYEYANRLSERGHMVNVVHPFLLYPDEATLKQKMKNRVLQIVKRLLREEERVKWFDISPRVHILIVDSLKEGNIPEGDVIIATAWQTAEHVAEYSMSKGGKFYLVMDVYPWLGSKDKLAPI